MRRVVHRPESNDRKESAEKETTNGHRLMPKRNSRSPGGRNEPLPMRHKERPNRNKHRRRRAVAIGDDGRVSWSCGDEETPARGRQSGEMPWTFRIATSLLSLPTA